MADSTPFDDGIALIRPVWILVVLLIEFALLVALLAGWYYLLPYKKQTDFGLIGGLLPLIVPWGGAIGGVSNALVGVSSHWALFGDRRPSGQSKQWNAWYLVQLPLGAVFGTISTLIVVFLVGSIGTTTGGKIDVTPAGAATLLVIAFAVGYRQDVFRQLLGRVTKIILGNSGDRPDGTLFSLPSDLDFDAVPVNKTKRLPLVITNDGQSLLQFPHDDITLDGADKAAFTIGPYPSNAAAGSSAQMGITFSPTAETSYAADLVVTVGAVEKRVALTGKGTLPG